MLSRDLWKVALLIFGRTLRNRLRCRFQCMVVPGHNDIRDERQGNLISWRQADPSIYVRSELEPSSP